MDSERAETFWPLLPIDSCHFDQYDILYEGIAMRLTPKANQTAPIVYIVMTQDTTFALTKIADLDLCGYKLTQTEHLSHPDKD